MKISFLAGWFLIFSVTYANANEFILSNAPLCDGESTSKTADALKAGKEMGDIYSASQVTTETPCLGWTNMGAGDIWFDLNSDLKVYASDLKSKKYLGSWPIAAPNPCDTSTNPNCQKPWWAGRWSAEESLEPEIRERFTDYTGGSLNEGGNLGCLSDQPLRYGNIDSDSQKELVVILKDNWMIASPTKKSVSFLALLSVNDWRSLDQTLQQLGKENNADHPQYASQFMFASAFNSKIDEQLKSPGYRGYAKLYFGDFNNDQKHDILQWRKLYESRLNKDPIKGFSKKSETLVHYSLIGGVYKKQATDTAAVAKWLSDKQLTWQKGYPSKSECKGQEGKLIPEMHDALLNDPDVLK